MGLFTDSRFDTGKLTLEEVSRTLYYDPNTDEDNLFPGCCGVLVFAGFEDYPVSRVKENRDVFISFLKSETDPKKCKKAICMTSINHHQVPVVAPILKEAGFKLVTKGVNKGYEGNSVFIWSKIIHRTRKSGVK